jgi:hypothetical protein
MVIIVNRWETRINGIREDRHSSIHVVPSSLTTKEKQKLHAHKKKTACVFPYSLNITMMNKHHLHTAGGSSKGLSSRSSPAGKMERVKIRKEEQLPSVSTLLKSTTTSSHQNNAHFLGTSGKSPPFSCNNLQVLFFNLQANVRARTCVCLQLSSKIDKPAEQDIRNRTQKNVKTNKKNSKCRFLAFHSPQEDRCDAGSARNQLTD